MAIGNVVTWAGRSLYNNRLVGTAGSYTLTQPLFIGWGLGASGTGQVTGSAFTDVNLFNSIALQTSPESRVTGAGTIINSAANVLGDTYQVVGTVTALAARNITEVGIFDVGGATANLSAQATVATLTAGATSVVIGANTRAFPASNNYYAQVESEVVLVTGGQGTTTLTFTRGALGTTAVTHAAAAVITTGGDGGAWQANNSSSLETWNASGANGGSMFVHADFGAISLNTSDSIQFTLKTQLQ